MLVIAKSETDPRWLCRAIGKSRLTRTFAKMSADDLAEVERLARQTAQYTAKVRQAFLDAIAKIKDQIDPDELTRLIRVNPQGAIDYVNVRLSDQGFRPIAGAATEATVQAGIAAARAPLGVPNEIRFSFGHTNPDVVARLQSNEFRLIRELSDQSRKAVADAIRKGITEGRNPIDVARDVRAHIGLTERQAQAVRNYRQALQDADRSALNRVLRDRRFDPTVRSALGDAGNNLSASQIDSMVARYEARTLKYRAETIARTESTRALNEGNTQTWRQAVADGLLSADQITRRWIYTRDDRTRDAHIAIPGMNPDGVGLDQPFETPLGPLLYPGDPAGTPDNVIQCRCATIIRYKPKKAA